MNDVHKNLEEYNPGKKQKVLIMLDDMNVDLLSNNKVEPIVTEPFISGTLMPPHMHQAGVTHIQKSIPACQISCLFTRISTLEAGKSKI